MSMEQPLQGNMDRAINFIFIARWRQRISIEIARDAMQRLQGRHSAFEYGNQRNSERQSIGQSKLLPVMEINDCRDDFWQEFAAKEMTIPFPATGPFVRVNLLQNEKHTDMLLTFDHQVCDGMSGILLLRDLSYLLNHSDKTLPVLPVQPTIWDIMPEKAANDWLGKLRIAIFMKFLDFSVRIDRNKPTMVFDPKFRIDAFALDRQMSRALVECCRRENTSVHAAICVTWMLALQSMFNESGIGDSALRSVSSPVSLRHFLPDDKKECAGMYYSTVKVNLDCNHSHDFWDSARQIKTQMDIECTKSSFFDTPRFFKAMYERRTRLAKGETFTVPELPVDYDFSISNMGKLDDYFDVLNGNSTYKIDAIYGPMVNAFKGEKTVGVCTINGKIGFVLTSFEGDLDDEFIRSLIEKVRVCLKIASDPIVFSMEPDCQK